MESLNQGDTFQHLETAKFVSVENTGRMKDGDGEWKECVTYLCDNGEFFTRDRASFLGKFRRVI